MKPKVEIGQEMCIVSTDSRNCSTFTVKVTKVGRKYFTVSNVKEGYKYPTVEFEINDWYQKGDYRSWTLYLNLQEYEEVLEIDRLNSQIRTCFSSVYGKSKLSLDQLKRINSIIQEQ